MVTCQSPSTISSPTPHEPVNRPEQQLIRRSRRDRASDPPESQERPGRGE